MGRDSIGGCHAQFPVLLMIGGGLNHRKTPHRACWCTCCPPVCSTCAARLGFVLVVWPTHGRRRHRCRCSYHTRLRCEMMRMPHSVRVYHGRRRRCHGEAPLLSEPPLHPLRRHALGPGRAHIRATVGAPPPKSSTAAPAPAALSSPAAAPMSSALSLGYTSTVDSSVGRRASRERAGTATGRWPRWSRWSSWGPGLVGLPGAHLVLQRTTSGA